MFDNIKIIIPKGEFNCRIEGFNIPHQDLKDSLRFEVQGSTFSPARQMGYWDGFEYLYKFNPSARDKGEFPFGLLTKVENILKSKNIAYQIIDERTSTNSSVSTQLNVNLREYQMEAVNIALAKKSGILNIATGGGKCVRENTLIPTNEGILPISYFKDITEKDVIQLKGKSEYVFSSEVYDGGEKNTIIVELSSGLKIEGSYNHPILTLSPDNELIFKRLSDITREDIIATQYNSQLFSDYSPFDFFPFLKGDLRNFELNFAYFATTIMEYGDISDDVIVIETNSLNHEIIVNSFSKILPSDKMEITQEGLIIQDEVLVELFKECHESTIPLFILKLNKEYLFEFISYYLHHFSNRKVLEAIQVILMNFGVISFFVEDELRILNKNYFYKCVYSELDEMNSFYTFPYHYNINKQILEGLAKFMNIDTNVPIFYNHYSINYFLNQYPQLKNQIEYQKIALLVQEKYFFDRVRSVDYSYGQVYDFVVPGQNSFVGNGFVNHNTKTSTGIIHYLGRKTVFYVHTIDLLDQAKEEFEQTLGVKVGQVGGGIVDIQDITVATIQTVIQAFDKKYEDSDSEMDKGLLKEDKTDITNFKEDIKKMVETAEVIIFDECQHLGAESFYEIAKRSINASFRYGLSATPWRDDGKELYIEAGLGSIIYSLSASWLIDNGHLIKPYIRYYNGQQNSIHPFADKRKYSEIYKQDIVENHARNSTIIQLSKMLADKNKTALIIIQQKKHGEMLRDLFKEHYGIDVPFVHGGTPKKKRRQQLAQFKRYYTPQMVEDKKGNKTLEKICPIMICSTIADEGLDIPHLSTVIMAGGGKSTTRILQRVGRALRQYRNDEIGYVKDTAFVVDFYDTSKYLIDHTEIRRKTMEKESSFAFMN